MSKISLTDEYGTYTIDCFDELSTLTDMFERLVIPVLVAAGFSRESINAYMDNKPA